MHLIQIACVFAAVVYSGQSFLFLPNRPPPSPPPRPQPPSWTSQRPTRPTRLPTSSIPSGRGFNRDRVLEAFIEHKNSRCSRASLGHIRYQTHCATYSDSSCSFHRCALRCHNRSNCQGFQYSYAGECRLYWTGCTANQLERARDNDYYIKRGQSTDNSNDCTSRCHAPGTNHCMPRSGTCVCRRGWDGVDCATPRCSRQCQNGGTCSAPDHCACASGYRGRDCSEMDIEPRYILSDFIIKPGRGMIGISNTINCPDCRTIETCATHCRTNSPCLGFTYDFSTYSCLFHEASCLPDVNRQADRQNRYWYYEVNILAPVNSYQSLGGDCTNEVTSTYQLAACSLDTCPFVEDCMRLCDRTTGCTGFRRLHNRGCSVFGTFCPSWAVHSSVDSEFYRLAPSHPTFDGYTLTAPDQTCKYGWPCYDCNTDASCRDECSFGFLSTWCTAFAWNENARLCEVFFSACDGSTLKPSEGTLLYQKGPLTTTPIDGSWSEWQQWGSCSVTCGYQGVRDRYRYCDSPAPQNGGSYCSGSANERDNCPFNPQCVAEWSEWGQWEQCTTTCGVGQRFRIRSCPSTSCVGNYYEEDNCPTNPTCIQVIDGEWYPWSAWSQCSASCGQSSVRNRYRECRPPRNGGRDCYGDSHQQEFCTHNPDCPTWNEWSSWGACSSLCGRGSQTRTRQCSLENLCSGASSDTRECHGSSPTCPQDGNWSSWTEWSACDPTCGDSATRYRQRECNNPAPLFGGRQCVGNRMETLPCTSSPCPTEPSTVPAPSPTPEPAMSVDGYELVQGRDCNSFLYRFCETSQCNTAQRCADKCDSTEGCQAFRYHIWGRYCYLLFEQCRDDSLLDSNYYRYYKKLTLGTLRPSSELTDHPPVSGFSSRYGDCPHGNKIISEQPMSLNSDVIRCGWNCEDTTGCFGFTFRFNSSLGPIAPRCFLFRESCSDAHLIIDDIRMIHYTREFYTTRGCGFPSVPRMEPSGPQPRIVGGVVALPNTWPWMAQLQSGTGSHFCGASLIGSQWAVSAAHCVAGTSETNPNIRLNVGRFNKYFPEPNEQTITIDRLIRHPQYDSSNFNNDIVLLHLSHPVSYTYKISPVCIAQTPATNGSTCYVTGWGDTRETLPYDTLNEVAVNIIEGRNCHKHTDNQICAGHLPGGRDSCQGDSGGPLMCRNNDGIWFLQGIVSFGFDCALPNLPGVYTKVANYFNWIAQNISS